MESRGSLYKINLFKLRIFSINKIWRQFFKALKCRKNGTWYSPGFHYLPPCNCTGLFNTWITVRVYCKSISIKTLWIKKANAAINAVPSYSYWCCQNCALMYRCNLSSVKRSVDFNLIRDVIFWTLHFLQFMRENIVVPKKPVEYSLF